MASDGVYLTGSSLSLPQRFIIESRVNPVDQPNGVWVRRDVVLGSIGWAVKRSGE